MAVEKPSTPSEPPEADRLDSWKEIATHLKRDERTVRRWEKEGLPVHRHVHKKKASVYASKSEIDSWWNAGQTQLERAGSAAARPRSKVIWLSVAVLAILSVGLGSNIGGLRDRLVGTQPAREITALAVLPLKNLSGDTAQDYFADGMTEALITELGKIRDLRVISRTSVMRKKDTEMPLAAIARELKVDAVVEGAVVREGGRVRVTAQLMQIRPERQLWAERYERDLTSILVLQGELARAIAVQIRARLTPEEQSRLSTARLVTPDAYEAYLKGLFFMEQLTEEGVTKGIYYFRKAIESDPAYAAAHAGLADGLNRAAINGYRPAKDAYPLAKAAASRALELDQELAEAHALMGVIKFRFDWDWTGAERDLKRAVELNPNSSRSHLGYSTFLLILGQTKDAIRVAQRNVELDPLTYQRHIDLAWKLSYAGRHDDAIAQVEKALELAPDSASAYAVLARNLSANGMHPEAISACERALSLSLEGDALAICGWVYVQAGRPAQARGLLQKTLAQGRVSPYQVALVHDALGETDHALRRLVQAYEERSPEMCRLKIDTFSGDLRSDPRFQDLLRRMNFPST
jgi:TolB-like protein/Tfp pilus assembly protein PilF